MTQALITVRGLGKRYRLGHAVAPNTLRDRLAQGFGGLLARSAAQTTEDFWALRDVELDVAEGEVIGIIGRNGAGKSTLLKILSQITEPTTGEVRIGGRVASLLEVGTGFHQELSGRENIYLNGAILGMRKAEIDRKFDEIVDFSGVERFLDTPVKRYSSGMTVRLAFAVAAHLEPEILLIDEVLAVGDAEFQKRCLGKMDNVACSGRTILFVSHNMAAVSSLCRRTVLLEQGALALDADTDQCVKRYLQAEGRGLQPGVAARYLISAAFLDPGDSSRAVSAIPMGGGVVLKARFKCPAATQDPKFGLVLKRKMTGDPAFGINTEMAGVARPKCAGEEFEVSVHLSDLRLVQGEYVADLYLGNAHGNFEVIAGAVALQVTEADVFGTGKVPLAHTGPMYVTPRIEISEVREASGGY
jgi:lipopolysaccharide transport system ATP-binding protein